MKTILLTITICLFASFVQAQGSNEFAKELKSTLEAYQKQETITPDSLFTHLAKLTEWAKKETNPIHRSIIQLVLAEKYADYLNENQYSINQRTALNLKEIPTDIREWSNNLFIKQIDSLCTSSLSEETMLLNSSSKAFYPLIEKGNDSQLYHHDIYHTLHERVVAIYQKISLLNDDEWNKREIEKLHQQRLNLYRTRNINAYVLSALNYYNWKVNEVSSKQYDKLLQDYSKQLSKDVCTEVYISKADYFVRKDSLNEALSTCNEGIRIYPNNKRINRLRNIKENLISPKLHLNFATQAHPDDSIEININWKNIEEFTLNIYETDLRKREVDEKIKNIPRGKRIASHRYSLAKSLYHQDTIFKIPSPHKLGVYLIEMVTENKSVKDSDLISITRFKLIHQSLPQNEVEITALDWLTGHPIQEVEISILNPSNQVVNKGITDKDGKVVIPWEKEYRYYVAEKGEDVAMTRQNLYYNNQEISIQKNNYCTLLTDRSIYRPGQTIYVKGITYEQYKHESKALTNQSYTIRLLDANHQEVSKQEVITNEFGSFTTAFQLPAACLNGQFILSMVGINGAASVKVEAYKRPTFEISLYPIEVGYQYGDTILIKGNVKNYNGSKVSNAKVNFRLLEEGFYRNAKPLEAGVVMTDSEGDFSFPIKIFSPEEKNNFSGRVNHYAIETTVTDEAGETHVAKKSIYCGNRSYQMEANLPSTICKDDSLYFSFTIKNMNQVILPLDGKCSLYLKNELKWQGDFTSNQPLDCSSWKSLPSGNYRIELSTNDSHGREERITLSESKAIYSKSDTCPPHFSDIFVVEENLTFDEFNPAIIYLGTSHNEAFVMMKIFDEKRLIKRDHFLLSDSLMRIEIPYKEEYGEQITLQFGFVKKGDLKGKSITIKKKEKKKQLQLQWSVFRNRLTPGQTEEWRLTIKDDSGNPLEAEMLAYMYDASLDQLYPHRQQLSIRHNYYSAYRWWREQYVNRNYLNLVFPQHTWKVYDWCFDELRTPLPIVRLKNITHFAAMRTASNSTTSRSDGFSVVENNSDISFEEETKEVEDVANKEITPRTNLAETAFFYPQLRTNEQGEISFSFTLPESLTTWRFHSIAHTKQMETGSIEESILASKEFMLTPHLPRFIRSGDETEISATLANMSNKVLAGKVTLTLFNPQTEKRIIRQTEKFVVEANGQSVLHFTIKADEKYPLMGIRMIAESEEFSDGEQHLLPVLSHQVYVTETLPMPIRGKETRQFSLESLFNNNHPDASRRQLTIEFTSNPAWMAVQALPAISNPQNDNAISWATAYYANSLAAHILQSQPNIQQMVESWQVVDSKAFESELEKNQELRNILLNESPWMLEAANEHEQRARIVTLFDKNQQNNARYNALTKLSELQNEEGGWSWYKGMRSNLFVTTFVMTQWAHLTQLTSAPLPTKVQEMQKKAFNYLHKKAREEYDLLKKSEKEEKEATLSSFARNYLYIIGVTHQSLSNEQKKVYDYLLRLAGNQLSETDIESKAQVAILLHLAGKKQEAVSMASSIKKMLVTNDELGAHFAFLGSDNLSAHTMAMEAIRMISPADTLLLEEMKIALLKQKQTNLWESPIASVNAIHALLCEGENLLGREGKIAITLGKEKIDTSPSPGLGYSKHVFKENKAQTITIKKEDEGIAWGAVYAQYYLPIEEVEQQESALTIQRQLYVEKSDAHGHKELKRIEADTPLTMGDKIVSRLVLTLDRDMDFIQLKEQRAACLEPISQLSGYRRINGLGCYYEGNDSNVCFFIDHLEKGTYVWEQGYYLTRSGKYAMGIVSAQCAYAPEFIAHSTSETIWVSR